MATLGTLYTQLGGVTRVGVFGAVGVGAIASAILVANNLRDIPTDRASGKITLAVRLGDRGTRALYAALVAVAALAVFGIALTYLPALIALVAFALAWRPVRLVLSGAPAATSWPCWQRQGSSRSPMPSCSPPGWPGAARSAEPVSGTRQAPGCRFRQCPWVPRRRGFPRCRGFLQCPGFPWRSCPPRPRVLSQLVGTCAALLLGPGPGLEAL